MENHDRALRDRVQTLEIVLWGPTGNNGLRGDVREISRRLEREITQLKADKDREVGHLRDELEQIRADSNKELATNFDAFRARVMAISLALVGAAAAIVGGVVSGAFH